MSVHNDPDVCPKNAKAVTQTMRKAEKSVSDSPKLKAMVDEVLKIYGKDKDSNFMKDKTLARKCYYLADFAIMDRYHRDKPLIDDKSDLYKRLVRCYTWGIFSESMDYEQTKLWVTPVYEEMLKNFKMAITKHGGKQGYNNVGSLDKKLKYVHLSAHDSTISSHL